MCSAAGGQACRGLSSFFNTFFIVVAQIPATRVVERMRRTQALAATCALFAIGPLAVPLAPLTSSTLTATVVLAGVAIVIAIGECAQFIVVGPTVADLAPPHLIGRYMSLYGLSFTAGVALGPATAKPAWCAGRVLIATAGQVTASRYRSGSCDCRHQRRRLGRGGLATYQVMAAPLKGSTADTVPVTGL